MEVEWSVASRRARARVVGSCSHVVSVQWIDVDVEDKALPGGQRLVDCLRPHVASQRGQQEEAGKQGSGDTRM